jgi:hypothetical protein
MLNQRTVLAITKRNAELCGTESLLRASGIKLVDADSLTAARRIIHDVKGVIVCKHSWSEREHESIVSELEADHPEVAIIVRCPGCTGCDEANQRPGTLSETQQLTNLISATASDVER